MVTNEFERDLNDQSGLKRPGRVDFRVFQNTPDAGDGHPGLQRCFRNYLHEGGMEKDLDMNNKAIKDLASIDGGGDSVVFNDDIHVNSINNNIFYCSSESEINSALTSIGSNGGIIIIEPETINLTATININGGGSYIIMGMGDKSVIDCNGNRSAFSITSATSCVLKNLKVDANDLTSDFTYIININESSNNRITVDNVSIIGDSLHGVGIAILSDNCIVKKCIVTTVADGIYVYGSNNNIISKNICHSIRWEGVIVTNTSTSCVVKGNITYNNSGSGILISESSDCVVKGNISYNNNLHGIILNVADNNTITGNTCNNNDIVSASNNAGIWIVSSDNNTITGNTCNNNNNTGSGTGFGINITDSLCDNNTVVGNTCSGNDTQYNDSGTGTVDDSSKGTTNANLNNFG